jgi:hypothetical protein
LKQRKPTIKALGHLILLILGGCMLQSVRERPSDEAIIHHLGAAVLLCWHQLPCSVQDKILTQADDAVGIAPVPEIRHQIAQLMLRRA